MTRLRRDTSQFFATLIALTGLAGTVCAQDLIISGVIDGPLTGGVPKAIELYAVNDVADLSAYGVSSANNGGGTTGTPEFTLFGGAAVAGTYIYVASETPNFTAFFGFAPDFTSSAASINGDDAIELFQNGVVVDVFGDVNLDGSNQPWEYLDGWAYRVNGTGPDGASFALANWAFSGPNALDGESTNATAATPFPLMTFATTPPTPAVIINEIHADPDGSIAGDANGDGTRDASQDEFVEIVNDTGAELNLSGWSIMDGVGPRHVFPQGTVVPDDCAIVVFGGGAPLGSFGGAIVQTASTGFLGFNNTGDTVRLFNGSATETEYVYGAEGGNDQSLTRSPELTGNFVLHTTVSSALYSPGTRADGTAFSGCPEVIEEVLIHEVQGAGTASPLVGQTVIVEGVVTGDLQDDDADTQNSIRGFYLQEEDADTDADPLTSEGIFVFDGSNPSVDVNVGDVVRVTGAVAEFFGETQIAATSVEKVGSGSVAATNVTLPAADVLVGASGEYIPDLERYEGMLVTFPNTLTVTELFNLDRFGEIHLAAGGRPYVFTNMNEPDAAGLDAHLRDVGARSIMLDDGLTVQNPDPIRYPAPDGLPNATGAHVRLGDTIAGLTGNIRYSRGSGGSGDELYRVMPTADPLFTSTNPRPAVAPATANSLTVAGFNVLNFFSTIDENGNRCGPQIERCRGADNQAEYDRQLQKAVSALLQLDADIVGLVELENNASASLAALVDGVNAVLGVGTYDYIDAGVIGLDVIKVGLIYRTTTVAPFGDFAILDSSVDPNFNDGFNRPVLAQSFEELATTGVVTVAVNHLKSKGAPCDVLGDPDTGDGQGNCNLTRTSAAVAMAAWLAADPTGSGDADVLVVGDFNAYLMEDPIDAFRDAGYTNLVDTYIGTSAYSFSFDRQIGVLDHAVASLNLFSQVTGTAEWHINADEADALDYNLDFGRNPNIFDGGNEFRASDHDPIVVSMNLDRDLDLDADGVRNDADFCPNTSIPEAAPTRALKGNRYALTNGDLTFDTASRNGNFYTTTDTAGCSCEQIVEQTGAGNGHLKFGCSNSLMQDWIAIVTD